MTHRNNSRFISDLIKIAKTVNIYKKPQANIFMTWVSVKVFMQIKESQKFNRKNKSKLDYQIK